MTAYEVSVSRLAAYDNVESFDLFCDFDKKEPVTEFKRIIIWFKKGVKPFFYFTLL